ncbi:MFS transporter [Paraoerskovia marina]|uniref:MFS transporter, UMF1 family n=1 Tax=Paraoerskovia marina TaxID=545619 RepID=A0A1H1SQ82_9CELL|nr:MFS transporter [Paraoerskovia marina]SDS50125.1 MFS transporter, UMF1 family [Paraoerskovia marina]
MPDDVTSATVPAPASGGRRRQVVAWSLWDWGSAAFNAVVTTFVFTRWITSEDFVEQGADATAVMAEHSAWLGWGLAAAGLVIAVLAPAIGTLADASGRRKLWLGINSAMVFASMVAMFFVRPEPGSLSDAVILGVVLLSVGNVFFELASVAYNALLLQISTPDTIGRVSGWGWGAGYVGGIVLLLVLFVGFINPDVGWFGVTGEDGMNIRVSVLISAFWFALFAVPVLTMVPEEPRTAARTSLGVADAYRKLGRDIAGLWRTQRSTLWYLVASAIYRDGLAGVFTFGAVIASGTFGFSASEVIVFAIAANLVAGLSTFVGGWLDDKVGPRRVVVWSLVILVAAGLGVFFLHDGGTTVFWVCGLVLSGCVGPAQSASRALLGRLATPGHEAEAFGLYATTGRAASFLAPLAFSVAVTLGGAQYWGILGLVAVILLGLVVLLRVRFPAGLGINGARDRKG